VKGPIWQLIVANTPDFSRYFARRQKSQSLAIQRNISANALISWVKDDRYGEAQM
jgi:hypothetical protein